MITERERMRGSGGRNTRTQPRTVFDPESYTVRDPPGIPVNLVEYPMHILRPYISKTHKRLPSARSGTVAEGFRGEIGVPTQRSGSWQFLLRVLISI